MERYETHLHTKQSSACGRSSGAEHVRYYKKLGYTGIFVTDHFFGGNTAAPRSGDWKGRVNAFCAGYEDAKAEGDKVGLDVFFGWEETFDGDDYLVYGLDKQWLLDHPEVEYWSRKDQFEQVHLAGGCVIQAHPFRCRDYIHRIHLALSLVDGVEVANAGNKRLWDSYALTYAQTNGMYMTAGSDNHFSFDGCPVYGIAIEERLVSEKDWVAHVINRKATELLVEQNTFVPEEGSCKLPLQSWLVNSKDELVRYQQTWLKD